MKIQTSSIGMTGTSSYQSFSGSQTATFFISPMEKLTSYMGQNSPTQSKLASGQSSQSTEKSNQMNFSFIFTRQSTLAQSSLEQSEVEQSKNAGSVDPIQTISDLRLAILRRILQIFAFSSKQRNQNPFQSKLAEYESQTISGTVPAENSQSTWTKTRINSSFYFEQEVCAYESRGFVQCEDGRFIDFGVTLELSQSFCSTYESISQQDVIFTDPLIINFDAPSASITDQKFLFDLDSDGKSENISFAGPGSGFLALDRNGNGIIDNGSELFGTKNGNGFEELSEFDSDSNGWIDENDEIFDKLKIWTKDEFGKDRLLTLKEADIGAICLSSAATSFHLKDDDNNTNALIRSTGIALKESGGVSTIQQIDLAQ